MKRLTNFFRRYAYGELSKLSAFIVAAAEQRSSYDAQDTNVDRFFEKKLKQTKEWNVPKRLAFPSIMTSDMVLRQHDRANWEHTQRDIQVFAALLIEKCRQMGIPMYVHCAFRTKTEQNNLLARNRSQLGWPKAPHCQGCAVDIVHSKFHWELTEDEWKLIGKIGKEIADKHFNRKGYFIKWGGDWDNDNIPVGDDPDESFWDPAHWELSNWRDNVRLTHAINPIKKTPRKILRENKV